MFHSPSIPTGYEPKPRSLLLHHSASPRREKVSDDLLKTLPGFSYSLVERRNFEKAFGSMLRSIGGVFLLKNVRRPNPDLVVHTSAPPSVKTAPRFFSPKLDRAALAAQNGPSVFYAEAAPYLSPEAKYGGGGLLMPSPVGDLYGAMPYTFNRQRTNVSDQVSTHSLQAPVHVAGRLPKAPVQVAGQPRHIPGYVPGKFKGRGYVPRANQSATPGYASVSRRSSAGPYLDAELMARHARATSQRPRFSVPALSSSHSVPGSRVARSGLSRWPGHVAVGTLGCQTTLYGVFPPGW